MNKVNKRRKATSIPTFESSTLYAILPHNKFLTVLNGLIDFCLDGGESKYITVNIYGPRWVKNIKDKTCLNKQQIKDVVAYLLFNCYFTVGIKFINIPMVSNSYFFINVSQ